MRKFNEKAVKEYNPSQLQRFFDYVRNLSLQSDKHEQDISTVKTDTQALSTTVSNVSKTVTATTTPSNVPSGKTVPKPAGFTYSKIDPPTLPTGVALPYLGKIIVFEWNRIYDKELKYYELEVYLPYDGTNPFKVQVTNPTDSSTTVKWWWQTPGGISQNFKARVRTDLNDENKSEWTLGGKWTSEAHWNTGLDTAAPDAISDLQATAGIKSITITFTNPSTSDFDHATILRSTGGSYTQIATANGIGKKIMYVDDSATDFAVTYTYKAVAYDNTGNASADSNTSAASPNKVSVSDIGSLSTKAFTSNIVFTPDDADTVSWAAGTIYWGDGTTTSIDLGSTGNMTSDLYRYIYYSGSGTALTVTTTISDAIGENKVVLCVARRTTKTGETKAYFSTLYGVHGINADFINANFLSAITAYLGDTIVSAAKNITVIGNASTPGYILFKDPSANGVVYLYSTSDTSMFFTPVGTSGTKSNYIGEQTAAWKYVFTIINDATDSSCIWYLGAAGGLTEIMKLDKTNSLTLKGVPYDYSSYDIGVGQPAIQHTHGDTYTSGGKTYVVWTIGTLQNATAGNMVVLYNETDDTFTFFSIGSGQAYNTVYCNGSIWTLNTFQDPWTITKTNPSTGANKDYHLASLNLAALSFGRIIAVGTNICGTYNKGFDGNSKAWMLDTTTDPPTYSEDDLKLGAGMYQLCTDNTNVYIACNEFSGGGGKVRYCATGEFPELDSYYDTGYSPTAICYYNGYLWCFSAIQVTPVVTAIKLSDSTMKHWILYSCIPEAGMTSACAAGGYIWGITEEDNEGIWHVVRIDPTITLAKSNGSAAKEYSIALQASGAYSGTSLIATSKYLYVSGHDDDFFNTGTYTSGWFAKRIAL